MKPSRFSKALDYLPPLVAFGAALVAVIGSPKWNEEGAGIDKVTPHGWIVAGIALVALITTLLVTLRNQKKQESQRGIRAQIAKTGKEQLLRGVERAICVFMDTRQWDKEKPEPQSPLDLLNHERRTALSSINLNGMSNYADGKGNVKWWRMFEDTANNGSAQITTSLQIYVTFFDAPLIEAATKLLNCEFMLRLRHIHDVVEANIHGDSGRSVRFFWVAPDEHMRSGYEEFWPLVTEVIELCSSNTKT